MKNKNGQGAIEFIVIFGAVFFFFILFLSVVNLNIQKKNLEKERIIAQNIALDVQYEINLAKESSVGYSRVFKIPGNILGKDYNINISDNRVYVSSYKIGVSYKVAQVNGTIKKGANNISKQIAGVRLN